MAGTVFQKPPSGLMRAFLRAPIYLYKAHLGWMMGERFLELRHIGRKSGKERRTVIEVVKHDQDTDCWYVASGWGKTSNWFRNLQAHPDVTITVRTRSLDVHAEVLNLDEATDALADYGKRHPGAYKKLSKMCTGAEKPLTHAGARGFAEAVPIVRFTPRTTH